MEVSLIKREKNPLLQREEIEFELKDAAVPPARKLLKEKITALTGAKSECVVIEKIVSSAGQKIFTGKAMVYGKPEAVSQIELAHLIKRGEKKAEKKEEKEAKPEAPKKEEAKKEAKEKEAFQEKEAQ